MRTHKVALTTVLAGALLLGACSDGDDDASDADATTTSAAELSVPESTLDLPAKSEDPTTTVADDAPQEVTTVVDKIVFGEELGSDGLPVEEATSLPASLEKLYYVMVLDSIAAGSEITVELRLDDTSIGTISKATVSQDYTSSVVIAGEIRPVETGLAPGD